MLFNSSPFGSQRPIPHPVVPIDNGWVYFAKKGGIEVDMMPMSLQEQNQREADISLLLLDAAETRAAQEGIDVKEAHKKFFDRMVGETIVQGDPPLPYLHGEKRLRYMEYAIQSRDLPIKVATLLMQHRFIYSIHVVESAKVKSKQLQIATPWFAIEVGMAFEFNGLRVIVTEPYDPDAGWVGVESIGAAIEVGSDGFLLDDDRKNYRIGIPDWTEEKTRTELLFEQSDGSPSPIFRMHQFYLAERGLADMEIDEAGSEGKQTKRKRLASKDKNSKGSEMQESSTGKSAIGESSPTESQMNGLAPETLVAVPHG